MTETNESQENQNKEEAAVPTMTTVERAEMLLQQDAAIRAKINGGAALDEAVDPSNKEFGPLAHPEQVQMRVAKRAMMLKEGIQPYPVTLDVTATIEEVRAKYDGKLEAGVFPTLVNHTYLLARVGGAYNAVRVEGNAVGSLFLHGLGAGSLPTASAVLGDLISIARQNNKLNSGFVKQVLPQADIPRKKPAAPITCASWSRTIPVSCATFPARSPIRASASRRRSRRDRAKRACPSSS